MYRKSFASLHPIVLFLYFALLLGFTMFVNDPINMLIAFILSHVVFMLYGTKKDVVRQLLYSISIILIIGITNPIFVHQGVTILFYYNNNPITLEAFYYGLSFGTMIASIITQCRIAHYIIDTDKILYIFARFIPVVALVFAMTLRLIPKFQRQTKNILQTQQTLGVSIHKGSLRWRIRVVTMVFSMMITWAFEHGVESADSMKARGYGSGNRSSYSCYKWNARDLKLIVWIGVLAMCMFYAGVNVFTHFYYYPHITSIEMNGIVLLSYLSYCALFFIPIVMEGRDYYIWNYVRVKI